MTSGVKGLRSRNDQGSRAIAVDGGWTAQQDRVASKVHNKVTSAAEAATILQKGDTLLDLDLSDRIAYDKSKSEAHQFHDSLR